MDKPADLIEYETMLLGRQAHMTARAKGDEGHLERSAYVLLSRIRMEGPMSIRQLSDVFGLDASTLNRKTAALIGAGLLERIPDSDGGIARKFRITDEGEHRLDDEREEMVRGLDKVLDDWTPEDVATFAAYLRRFNIAVERLSGQPWPRP
ncbi:MarR family transcriptional regulator [Streptomyces sp. SID3343]|uniref:MarR family winged helix-turn-helix transcriptional regulator n=1 Tax=Streptomyces sp. SID3343 TaxID=2690260 RepID=UPI00136E3261|nr:MarR family transcriptional regulator [Streptomyces sp. SID3343]MYV96894.1 MarR family transcriptional regulator [Streptomyces sp. SID3343]